MTVTMSTLAKGLKYGSHWWISKLLLILGCPISTTAQSGMMHGVKEWKKRYEAFSSACNVYVGGSFLSFAYMNLFCCGSMGWITLIRTGFSQPRYLLQNKETDARFSEAWVISISSGSKFIYIQPCNDIEFQNVWLVYPMLPGCVAYEELHIRLYLFIGLHSPKHTNAQMQAPNPSGLSNYRT